MGLEFWHFQIVLGTKVKIFRILAKQNFKYKIPRKNQEKENFKKRKSQRREKKPNFCKISSLSKNTRIGGTSAPLAYIQLWCLVN